MSRRWSQVCAAIVATLCLVGSVLPAVEATASPGDPRSSARSTGDPIAVTIDGLSPAVVPDTGPVTISGTITNVSDDLWRDINVEAVAPTLPPMTTAEHLSAAAESDPILPIGNRIADPGTFDTIRRLPPGESARYRLEVPVRLLEMNAGAGVYWLGVHVLGSNRDGRPDTAIGRARTFMPLVADDVPPVEVALVLSIRRRVTHRANGSVARPARWESDLSADGRLDRALRFGDAAGNRPITWLIDPAVVDAARQIEDGNPSRPLGPDPEAPDGAPQSPVPSSPPTADLPAGREVTGELLADRWLTRAAGLWSTGEVMVLPYGDLDVSSAVRRAPEFYTSARAASEDSLQALGLSGAATVEAAAPGISNDAVDAMPVDSILILDRDQLEVDQPPTTGMLQGVTTLVDSATSSGGPLPGPHRTDIGVRQRLLSEAAVRSLAVADDSPATMVAVLPSRWSPQRPRAFFAGLTTRWLQFRRVSQITSGPHSLVAPDALVYTRHDRRDELEADAYNLARALISSGRQLQRVLPDNSQVATVISHEALTDLSVWSRSDPKAARDRTIAAHQRLTRQLGRIHVTAAPSVTLSSNAGSIPATVSNGLDQPVVVRLEGRTDPALTITTSEPLTIPPGGHQTVLLRMESKVLGVHNVELVVTDLDGRPLGGHHVMPVRSTQVSSIIWWIMGGGLTLLFVTIGLRLYRRLRAGREAAS